MKILIFSVAYHPFVGGAEVAVKEITDRIPDIEFHLVTVNLDGKQPPEEKIGNVFVHRVGGGIFGTGYLGKLLFPFTGAWKALSLQRAQQKAGQKFDATWSIMANYAGFAALFFKMKRPEVPFILTLQEGDPISYIKRQVWFVYPLFQQIFRRADRIQTISNYLADFARSMGRRGPRSWGSALKGQIEVIPNGVDVSLFGRDFPASELENFKNKLGKNLGDVFLVTASRLVEKNGLADVMRALTFLPENFKFLILGTGQLEYSLRNLARKLGLTGSEDRVKFLGFVRYDEIPKYLKVSDIFIRPSLSEGMGNSFIEAMAAGIPVIATPVGGIPDFLRGDASKTGEPQTGFFCKVHDPKSIADQVKKISEDGMLRTEVVKNARELAFKKYTWELIAREMKEKVFSPFLDKLENM